MLDRRKFIKNTSMLGTLPFLPNFDFLKNTKTVVRTAHIGVGGMGKADWMILHLTKVLKL